MNMKEKGEELIHRIVHENFNEYHGLNPEQIETTTRLVDCFFDELGDEFSKYKRRE